MRALIISCKCAYIHVCVGVCARVHAGVQAYVHLDTSTKVHQLLHASHCLHLQIRHSGYEDLKSKFASEMLIKLGINIFK